MKNIVYSCQVLFDSIFLYYFVSYNAWDTCMFKAREEEMKRTFFKKS